MVEACQRKGLGRHMMTLMEMVARKTNMARLSLMVMTPDENTKAFLSKLKKGAFAPDESMVDICGFDPDLEGFDVISLALAPPLPKVAPVEEAAVDEATELEAATQLVMEKVTQAFAQKHGAAAVSLTPTTRNASPPPDPAQAATRPRRRRPPWPTSPRLN